MSLKQLDTGLPTSFFNFSATFSAEMANIPQILWEEKTKSFGTSREQIWIGKICECQAGVGFEKERDVGVESERADPCG